MFTRRHFRTAVAAALSVAAVAATGAAPASAGVLVASAPNCDDTSSSRVFLPWADASRYFLAPDGGFEAGATGWTLKGAAVTRDNESYAVSGPGSSALAVENGESATAPVVCVGTDRPTLRFFVKRTSGGLLSTLNVSALVEDNLGLVRELPVGVVLGGSSSWQPSSPMVVAASLLPLLPNDMTPIAFRFSAAGGSYEIDDVYVDPFMGH